MNNFAINKNVQRIASRAWQIPNLFYLFTEEEKTIRERNQISTLTPMIAFSSGIVTCLARSTA